MFYNGFYHGTVFYPDTGGYFEDRFAFREDGFVLWSREHANPVAPPQFVEKVDFKKLHAMFYSYSSLCRSDLPEDIGYYSQVNGQFKCTFYEKELHPNCYGLGIYDCFILYVVDSKDSISINRYLSISLERNDFAQTVRDMKPLLNLVWRPI